MQLQSREEIFILLGKQEFRLKNKIENVQIRTTLVSFNQTDAILDIISLTICLNFSTCLGDTSLVPYVELLCTGFLKHAFNVQAKTKCVRSPINASPQMNVNLKTTASAHSAKAVSDRSCYK